MQVIKEVGTVLDNVYALGDCAQIEGNPLPATAQVGRSVAAELTSGRKPAGYPSRPTPVRKDYRPRKAALPVQTLWYVVEMAALTVRYHVQHWR